MPISGVTQQKNAYAAGNYTKTAANRTKTKDTDKTDKTGSNGVEGLSDRAKKLLEQLKKTYKNMDFMVADYHSDEEAAQYLSRGTKEFSALIEPEVLEEMAADEETKEKYTRMLDDATNKLSDMKEQLGDQEDEVKSLGISLKQDGSVSYFADLEKMSENQKERIEKSRETRKEEKAAQEKSKKTRVHANSVKELMDKIKNVDWDKIKATDNKESGSRFDYSI